jgi:hypothetical protein
MGHADDPMQSFNRIHHVAVAREGNVYAFDVQASEIRIFQRDGRYSGAIGRAGLGPCEFRAGIGFVEPTFATGKGFVSSFIPVQPSGSDFEFRALRGAGRINDVEPADTAGTVHDRALSFYAFVFLNLLAANASTAIPIT